MAAFLKKHEKWIFILIGLLAFVGAILMLFVAAPHANAPYKRTMDIIIGLLFLLLFSLCLAYMLLTRDKDPNFFLFDRAKKKNQPLNKLSFTTVNERLNFLETMICSSEEDLWKKNLLENTDLGYHNVYRPLLAYKMIYDLADRDIDTYWFYLYNVPSPILSAICRALEEGGGTEFAKMLHSAVEKYRECQDPAQKKAREEALRTFVCKNMGYLRGEMMKYVKKNIDLFY